MTEKRILFTTSTYAYLEPDFLAHGGFDRGEIVRKAFPDGERYLRIADGGYGPADGSAANAVVTSRRNSAERR